MIDLAPPFLEGAAATPPTGLGEAPVVVGVEAVGEIPAAEQEELLKVRLQSFGTA
jgi:hypothetical protein